VVTDSATGRSRLGEALFEQARFDGDIVLDGVEFTGDARFEGARFAGDLSLDRARFGGGAWFGHSVIDGGAVFGGAEFSREASFRGAIFGGGAWFGETEFHGDVWFDGTECHGDAVFLKASFERAVAVGPLTCSGTLDLSGALFGAAVTIEAAAAAVRCRRTRWVSTAAVRLRHAGVDLTDAVLEHPVSIAARPRPFTVDGVELVASGLTDAGVGITSLRGVDTAHLALTDVDLTNCLFSGAIHLDQLRLEGQYSLPATPSGPHRRGMRPTRWTSRRTLVEEHYWRAARSSPSGGWTPAPEGEDILEPAALAPVYRQLRKSFEDAKHEPGAADFYYGEMEMRRYADDIPRAERSLLTAYWALSGYGLRASRALVWLLAAMAATVVLMMLWGLPQRDPMQTSRSTLTGRHGIVIITDQPDPANPEGPLGDRLSTERFDKSLRVVIDSVVFRSSDQDLTTAGTYTEMGSRLSEPLLLGLAVLAVRNRVKR
jgi:uncharacterized protein YjbI with pentapeptide repeats